VNDFRTTILTLTDLDLLSQTVAMFVRLWLAHTPRLPLDARPLRKPAPKAATSNSSTGSPSVSHRASDSSTTYPKNASRTTASSRRSPKRPSAQAGPLNARSRPESPGRHLFLLRRARSQRPRPATDTTNPNTRGPSDVASFPAARPAKTTRRPIVSASVGISSAQTGDARDLPQAGQVRSRCRTSFPQSGQLESGTRQGYADRTSLPSAAFLGHSRP
jgi:hypothetical protein